MAEIKEFKIRLTENGAPSVPENASEAASEGRISIQYWNHKDRAFRAAKLGAMCLGLALVSVLIPMLHFILVPSFVIASPIVAFFTYKQESIVAGGQGVCPGCLLPFTVAKSSNKFPLKDLCTECHRAIEIQLLEAIDDPAANTSDEIKVPPS